MTTTANSIRWMIAMAMTTLVSASAQTITASVHPVVVIAGLPTEITIGNPIKDDLLAGTAKFAQGASSVTEINLDPTTMGMMSERGRDSDLAKKLTLMVVHRYTYDKPGMYNQADVEAFRKKLEDGSWSCYVHMRSENGSSDICSRAGADQNNELVIVKTAPQKLTFIHVSGKMSLNELSEMSGQANGIAPYEYMVAPRVLVAPRPPRPPKEPKEPKDKTPQAAPVAPAAPAAPAAPVPPPQ
jgi:hypothetical protein